MNNLLARGIYKVKTITYNDQLMDYSAFTYMNQKITNICMQISRLEDQRIEINSILCTH